MGDSTRILQGLKSRSIDIRLTSLNKLVEQIEDTQDLSAELITGLKKIVTSSDTIEKATGLSTLISICSVTNETNLNNLAFHFLQLVSLKNILSKEDEIINLASQALGELVSAPTTTTFELADEEFRYALNTLKVDTSKDGFTRYAACCEIKAIAQKLPMLFAVYLGEFLGSMWNAVRDQKDYIREIGVFAFALSMKQIESREDLFEKVLVECLRGINPDALAATIHGSVLTLYQMIEKAEKLILPRFREACEAIMKIKDHKNLIVKQAVVDIIPVLVGFILNHRLNDLEYAMTFTDYIFKTVGNIGKEYRNEVLTVLGRLATLLNKHFLSSVNPTVALINQELKKKPIINGIFDLLRGVVKTLGPKVVDYFEINVLISTIFNNEVELNVNLLDFLSELASAVLKSPDHKTKTIVYSISDRLLTMIFSILNQRVEKNYTLPRNEMSSITSSHNEFLFTEAFLGPLQQLFAPSNSIYLNNICYECDDHKHKIQTVLALFSLSNFDFHNTFSLGFLVQSCVLPYLEDPCTIIRQYAVITTCALTKCHKNQNLGVVFRNELFNTVERLLNVALTDQSDLVRYTLFKNLKEDFFSFLALESNLSKLMVAVNDKSIKVRRVCVKLLGRLVGYNSSFILPCLTQLLSQYLAELQISGRMKQQQDAAVLLKALIKHTRQLLSPNLANIIDIYIQILKNSQHAPLVYQALRGISACAEVCKQQLRPFFHLIYPCLIDNIKDNSTLKRKGALIAILDVVTYTTRAIEPYLKFESLLDTLLEVIKTEERVEIRKLAEKALGKLGALDPVRYKELEKRTHSGLKSHKNSNVEKHLRELHQKSLELTPSHNIYYPLVALKALMNILYGVNSLNHEHIDQILQASYNIFRCYTRQISSLLENIIPILVYISKQVESPSKERLISTFRKITNVVGDDINDYVLEITKVIDLSVNSPSLLNEMLELLRELASHSYYENMTSFPQLLNSCINILNISNDEQLIVKTLSFFECLRGKIDQYLYITIPALLKIVQDNPNAKIRKQAIKVIAELCDKGTHPHVVDYISLIVDGLLTVIRNDINEIINDIFDALTCLVANLGSLFAVYIPLIQRLMISKKINHKRYENAVQDLIAGSDQIENPYRRPRPSVINEPERATIISDSRVATNFGPYKHEVNVSQLLAVCETCDRHTKEE